MSFALLSLTLAVGQPAAPEVLPLWADKAPMAVGDSAADKPSIKVFKAPADKATDAAVVICPGGGYGFLAKDHEGQQVAELFNTLGFTAYVLKYRIATKDRPAPLGKAPLMDAQRAIQTARADGFATVGIIGFSAGGHLASTAATHTTDGDPKSIDPVATQSSRPDFLVLGYPVVTSDPKVTHGGSIKNLVGDKPTAEQLRFFSNEKRNYCRTRPCSLPLRQVWRLLSRNRSPPSLNCIEPRLSATIARVNWNACSHWSRNAPSPRS